MTRKALALIGFLAVLVLGFFLYARFFQRTPPPVSQTVQNYTAPSNIDKHKEGTDSGESPITERGTRKATVTVRDTVSKQDTVGQVKTHTIEVVIPKDSNPIISVDKKAPPQKDVEIDVWTPPWFEIHPALVFGASINNHAEPSVSAGASFINAWEKWHVGAVADRFAAQVFLGYEVKSNIMLYIAKPIVEYHDKPVSATLGIAIVI